MSQVYATIAILLLIMLALNVVIRFYVLKLYRKLTKARVDFEPRHFFNQRAMEEEVLIHYPEMRKDILAFVKWVRFSTTMASIMLVCILYLGYILIKSQ